MSHSRIGYRRRRALAWSAGLSIWTLIAAGCCSQLPAATPEALGLIADRVEYNAIANHGALSNAIDNAGISQQQIRVARDDLKTIDTSVLTPADLESLKRAENMLKGADEGLDLPKSVTDARDELKVRAGQIVANLQQIQGILAEKVGQDQIMNNIVSQVRGAIDGEEEGG